MSKWTLKKINIEGSVWKYFSFSARVLDLDDWWNPIYSTWWLKVEFDCPCCDRNFGALCSLVFQRFAPPIHRLSIQQRISNCLCNCPSKDERNHHRRNSRESCPLYSNKPSKQYNNDRQIAPLLLSRIVTIHFEPSPCSQNNGNYNFSLNINKSFSKKKKKW